MAYIQKCDKCGRTCRPRIEKMWVKGDISAARCADSFENPDEFIGSFDLCPKCSKPLLDYAQRFFAAKK